MNYNIGFEFEGKQYEVDGRAYDVGRIVLPDGRLLEPTGWLERLPPIPTGLREILHILGSDPQVVAQHMNGVVAQQV